jgi:hypothetical protein
MKMKISARPGAIWRIFTAHCWRPNIVLSSRLLQSEVWARGVSVQVSAIKKQITNTKQITITKIQNSKQLAYDII